MWEDSKNSYHIKANIPPDDAELATATYPFPPVREIRVSKIGAKVPSPTATSG